MHSEIQTVKHRFEELYKQQAAYLASKPTDFLLSLEHEAEERMNRHETFAELVSSKVNHAACVRILEKRGVK